MAWHHEHWQIIAALLLLGCGGRSAHDDRSPPPSSPGAGSSTLDVICVAESDDLLPVRDLAVGPDGTIAAVGDYGGYTAFGPTWTLETLPPGATKPGSRPSIRAAPCSR